MSLGTVCHGPHNHPRINSSTRVENSHTQINVISHSIDHEYHLKIKKIIVYNMKIKYM